MVYAALAVGVLYVVGQDGLALLVLGWSVL